MGRLDTAKFKCGEAVFVMHNNEPVKKIVYVVCTGSSHNWEIWYGFTSVAGYCEINGVPTKFETEVFKTKKELLKHFNP